MEGLSNTGRGNDSWTVFINHKLVDDNANGYLYGTVNNVNNSICVLVLKQSRKINPNDLKLVGTWKSLNRENVTDLTLLELSDIGVELKLSTCNDDSIKCELLIHNDPVDCTCVLYSPSDFQQSYIFMQKAIENQIKEGSSVLQHVYKSLAYIPKPKPNLLSCIFHVIFSVILLCLKLTGVIFLSDLFVGASKYLLKKSPWLHKYLQNVACLSQLYERMDFIISVKNYNQLNPLEKLRCQNRIWSQISDCVFGVLFLLLFWYYDVHNQLLVFTVYWTSDIATKLTELINLLMGAPAGLKLNYLLTQFLGQFFLYHVYIWTGYVQLIQPLLSWIVYLSLPISILGLSFQISLLQDLLFLLTIHIYCFYVYAARVYNLEVSTLAALWRLFRGKKWNVLRERVDTAAYDIDQLFFGTLIFTILLFLLPTILLYYTVFVLFRIIILGVQGILSWLVNLINTVQIFSIAGWLIKSNIVAGDVLFDVVPEKANKNYLLVTLQASHLPLRSLFDVLKSNTEDELNNFELSMFLSKIFYGNLLYPWISPSQLKTNFV
ncbi:hypothetical protein LOTGIDRAFT_236105 [Lottia gigantea]|uniref:Phosphatidylinositol N-acetylglucosaminyltransferase subunit Q n=1 Tax=Lottia gigantea TaxID=225164 RepID=V3ZQG8_LOTGI|nr:hypothetical protein LOTGIDRAFT_236105 [Lottia gigantea]ESO84750.1 hypothetical protein LOTGIDRAFT_236105 [Lottia gigantea]